MTASVPSLTQPIVEPASGRLTLPWYRYLLDAQNLGDGAAAVYSSRAAAVGAVVGKAVTVILTLGYASGGDGGGAVYRRVAAEPSHAGKFQTADGSWWEITEPVLSVKMFGALGDGVADDLASMQAASDCASAQGGGSVFFPPGHYRSLTSDGIHVLSNVEYFGAGYASFLDFDWNVFQSATSFGRTTYGTYTYYAAHDVTAGDMKVTATTHADAAHFAAGNVILVRSTAEVSSGPGDHEPYFVEINRVTGADGSTGVITLEDPIADGCTGIEIAHLNGVFAENFSIHDLRCKANVFVGGSPWKIQACYKASICNCWGEGAGLYISNGLVRSTIHDIIYKFNVQTSYVSNLTEVATGSHESAIYNIQCEVCNLDGVNTYSNHIQALGVDEYSRRIVFHDIVIAAAEIDWFVVFGFGGSATGCQLWDISVTGRNVGQFLQYVKASNSAGTAAVAPFRVNNVNAEFSGQYNLGVEVTGFSGDPVQNVSIKNVRIDATPGDPFSTSRQPGSIQVFGDATDCEFDGVWTRGAYGAGYVYTNGGVYSNVIIRNSVLGPPVDLGTFQAGLIWEDVQRAGSQIAGAQRTKPGLATNSTTSGHVLLSLAVPQRANVIQGDCFLVRGSFHKSAGAATTSIVIAAMGSTLLTITLPPSASGQDVNLNARLTFVNNTFQVPTLLYMTGTYSIDGALTALANNVAFNNLLTTNTVELRAWLDMVEDLNVLTSIVEFLPGSVAP